MTSEQLAIIGGLVYIAAFILYNIGIFRGKKPSAVTWGIWTSLCLLNLSTYLKATANIWMSLIPIANIFLCSGTFLIVLLTSKNRKIEPTDLVALIIGLVAICVWLLYKSAEYANLVVQVAILAGFVPTWRLIRKDATSENLWPWIIWSVGYGMGLWVAVMSGGGWIGYVYYANCTILHLTVPIYAMYRIGNSKVAPKLIQEA